MTSLIARVVAHIGLIILAVCLLALTPAERKIVQHASDQLAIATKHGDELKAAAEQARVEANNANLTAALAASSALTAGEKAKTAEASAKKEHAELTRSEKENAKMRPIVAKVSGPWWFPGGRALLYGAKQSAISLLVIIAIGIAIAIGITLLTGGSVMPAIGLVGRIAGVLAKRLLALFRYRGKAVVDRQAWAKDNIEHRTIGSDPKG